jgi:hypothetical protein
VDYTNPAHQSSLGEPGEMKQSLKARVGAQRVTARIHLEPDQIAIPMRAALFKRCWRSCENVFF